MTEQRPPYLRSRKPTTAIAEIVRQAKAVEGGPDAVDLAHFTFTDTPHKLAPDDSPLPAAPSDEMEAGPGETPELVSGTDALLGKILDVLQQLVTRLFNEPGTPRSIAGHISSSSTDYETVASWQIPANQIGQLEELSFTSDEPDTATWRLTIAGVVQWADLTQQDPLNVRFPTNNQLGGDDEVLLEMHSDGAITVDADAAISGMERTP